MQRLKPLALLAGLLPALSADAEPACIAEVYVWELELERIERLSGDLDPHAVAAQLGRVARLRGGYHDPARPHIAARADLMGSTDGVGLRVSGEKIEP